MQTHYRHLSSEERAVIFVEHKRGSSARDIARLLERNVATISRELKRGASEHSAHYCPTRAAEAYRARRRHCGRKPQLIEGTWLHRQVHDWLIFWCWSPQQIAGRLKFMFPDDPQRHISHETIYAAIYAHPRGSLKQALIDALRQQKPRRGQRRRTPAGGSIVPEALRIVHRPETIETRLVPGHWEGDFIKGAANRSAVGTVVERKSRYVVLSKMRGCDAQAALEGFGRQMGKLPTMLRQSMTYDRGSEMACYAELAKRLKIDIWFADPYAPWQRGSNENTNGLLRQFLPKGTDLSDHSQEHLNRIATLLNQRPRKTLGWRTPEEVFNEEMNKFSKTVALDS